MADSHLHPALTRHRHTVPTISDDFYNYMKLIKKTEPEIMSKLLPILRTIPDSGIQLVNTKTTNYATWIKKQLFCTLIVSFNCRFEGKRESWKNSMLFCSMMKIMVNCLLMFTLDAYKYVHIFAHASFLFRLFDISVQKQFGLS
ncbi:unnamed protein product [Brassica oleracea var. botrytis]